VERWRPGGRPLGREHPQLAGPRSPPAVLAGKAASGGTSRGLSIVSAPPPGATPGSFDRTSGLPSPAGVGPGSGVTAAPPSAPDPGSTAIRLVGTVVGGEVSQVGFTATGPAGAVGAVGTALPSSAAPTPALSLAGETLTVFGRSVAAPSPSPSHWQSADGGGGFEVDSWSSCCRAAPLCCGVRKGTAVPFHPSSRFAHIPAKFWFPRFPRDGGRYRVT
jgi:hypothetical protein